MRLLNYAAVSRPRIYCDKSEWHVNKNTNSKSVNRLFTWAI